LSVLSKFGVCPSCKTDKQEQDLVIKVTLKIICQLLLYFYFPEELTGLILLTNAL
jgi:hypothetical protein